MQNENERKELKAIEDFNKNFSIGEEIMYYPVRKPSGVILENGQRGIIMNEATLHYNMPIVWLDSATGEKAFGNICIHNIIKSDYRNPIELEFTSIAGCSNLAWASQKKDK